MNNMNNIIVLCCSRTIFFKVSNLELGTLFLFADYVLPCFVYVITMNTINRETLNNSAIGVTDIPDNRAPTPHFTHRFFQPSQSV